MTNWIEQTVTGGGKSLPIETIIPVLEEVKEDD